MLSSHARTTYYALSIGPITALYYVHPALAAAVGGAITTIGGVRELLRRRKPAA